MQMWFSHSKLEQRILFGGLFACLIQLSSVAFAEEIPSQINKIEPLAQHVTVRFAAAPSNIFQLPTLYAVDKGYFKRVGLDVQIIKYQQAAVGLAPMLARGDLEIAPQAPAPSFFNLVAEGFGAKAVSVLATTKKGRAELAWIALNPDKVNDIKDYGDLKGKIVEGAALGSTANFIVLAAIQKAHLTPGKDVDLQARGRTNADFFSLAQAKAQDALGVIEPMASRAEKEGYLVRWKGLSEVAPEYQSVLMTTSEKFLQTQPAALQKFLEVYLIACREINATNGEWTEDFLRLMTQWTGLDRSIITDMGGVPYFEPNGRVSRPSLEFAQDLWIRAGGLKQRGSIDSLVDDGPINEALKVVGSSK